MFTRATPPLETRSILLITLSNVGDAVLTTPVMAALHDKYPQAYMDIVTDARAASLFRHCPYRRDIILKDKQAGWRGLAALVRRLRTTRYDLVVDLRTDGLSLLLRARRRLTRRGSRSVTGHAVERHFSVIRKREELTHMPPLQIWLSANEDAHAAQLLAGLPGQHWLALAPGARWQGKCWPVTHYSALLDKLQPHLDACVLLGDNADATLCRDIAAGLRLPHRNLAGTTDLLQAAAVLARTQIFMGNDSGLGHLAAACNIPTVTVFGPGNPARYHPWHPQARRVQSASGSIADVSVNAVFEQVRALLAETAGEK